MVIDTNDAYIGNTGEDNIQSTLPRELADSAKNIVSSGKWTTVDDSEIRRVLN